MSDFPPIILQTSETQRILPLQTWPVGTIKIPITPLGNSLLSSILVKNVGSGGSVKVNYFQTTSADEFGERTDLSSHPLITTTANFARQILVTKIHSKVFCEVVVSGDAVEFGIVVTVVSSFASDLDASLHFDQEAVDFNNDKGMPFMGLDPSLGVFQFIRVKDGLLGVTSETGTPFNQSTESTITTSEGEKDLLQFTVGAGVTRNVSRGVVSSYGHGIARMYFDDDLVGIARTDGGRPDAEIALTPSQSAVTGVVVKLTFELQETRNVPIALGATILGSEVVL